MKRSVLDTDTVSSYKVANLLLYYQLKSKLAEFQIKLNQPNPQQSYVFMYSVSGILTTIFR